MTFLYDGVYIDPLGRDFTSGELIIIHRNYQKDCKMGNTKFCGKNEFEDWL